MDDGYKIIDDNVNVNKKNEQDGKQSAPSKAEDEPAAKKKRKATSVTAKSKRTKKEQ
jgi:hypothetical protein